jgi:formylglycine-generating enzyme required for sulfatase activity
MPPADETPRPGESDIAAVRAWIEAGAPDFVPAEPGRVFVSSDELLRSIREDLERSNPRDRPFRRYFTLTHLYNAGLATDGLKTYRHGLSKLVNSLSWGKRIVPPQPMGPNETVLRIDLRDYRWDEAIWEQIVSANPYRVDLDSEDARYIAGATRCANSACRADWFVFAAARPPLYHQVLQLPQTAAELERLLRVDVDQNIRQERVARAGFNDSGVSKNNRMIERHESVHGAYWKSYDFARNVGRQSVFEHPLGPGPAGATFQHDGSEIIFNLPNDLQAYLLTKADGQRIDKGPINIVSDPKQADRAVVNGISCMTCHTTGIIDKADQVRKSAETPGTFSKGDLEAILALYKPRAEFTQLVKDDAERYTAAVRKTGAQISSTDPVVALAQRYEWEVDLKLAAAEVGMKPDAFLQAIGRSAQLTRAFGPLRNEGGTVQRQVVEAAFADLVRELEIGTIREVIRSKADPEIRNSIDMRFRRIPAGKFRMGSPASEADRGDDEQQHTVEITRPFAMGVFEVTQGEYERVVGKNPSFFSSTGGGKKVLDNPDTHRFPVENVTWEQAVEFCRRLTALPAEQTAGRKYRLPTEAEWEYACRGGVPESLPFHYGTSLSSAQANFDGNRPYGGAAKGVLLNRTTPVGSHEPNGFGLYDMHGNVAEWCSDWWDKDYYISSPAQDPTGPSGGTLRVLRGGSWMNDGKDCRAADRKHSIGITRYASNAYGFRVVLILDKVP